MIERQKEKYGWEFLFIGANIDAVETAALYGIGKERAVNYNADVKGTHILYESVSDAVCTVRACKPLTADWSEEIDADHQRRGKKIISGFLQNFVVLRCATKEVLIWHK